MYNSWNELVSAHVCMMFRVIAFVCMSYHECDGQSECVYACVHINV